MIEKLTLGELYTHKQPQLVARELFNTSSDPKFRINSGENFLVVDKVPDPTVKNLLWFQVLYQEQTGWIGMVVNSDILIHVPMIPNG